MRLASVRLLRGMTRPIGVASLDEGLIGWLTARHTDVERDLLKLGAWLYAQALRQGTGSALCRAVAEEVGAGDFIRILREGPSLDVPQPESLDIERLRTIGLAAMHAYLHGLSPAVAERFLLDRPRSRVARMVDESWVGEFHRIAAAISEIALWNSHEPTF